MPNRLVRDGFLDSEAVNRLSESAECLFHRLLLIADDAGRMDGRLPLLRARLYPLGTERTLDDLQHLVQECEASGLLLTYTREAKPYIQLMRWVRPGNTLYSRFPWRDGRHRVIWVKRETRDGTKEFAATSLRDAPPPGPEVDEPRGLMDEEGWKRRAIARGEMLAEAESAPVPFFAPVSDPIGGECRHISEDEDGVEVGDVLSPASGSVSGPPPAAVEEETVRPSLVEPAPESPRQAFTRFWQVYPKKRGHDAAWRVWKLKRPPLAQCLEAIARLRRTDEWRRDSGQFIPHPANWLAAGGWRDVPEVDLRRSQNAAPGPPRLLPGESPPEPVRDPDSWPDYLQAFPKFAGKHLAGLSHQDQENFKSWAFERQREAFLEARKQLS